MTQVPYTMTDNSIFLMLKGKPYNVDDSHPQFGALKEALKGKHDEDELASLASVPKYIQGKTFGAVVVGDDGHVYYKNNPVHGHAVDRLLQMLALDYDITPWANFLNRVMENPLESAKEELYLFLEASRLPLTPDGHFLAFKKVRSNYTDCHTGNFDNSVGATPTMKREDCNPDRNQTCSRGLHFCSERYLGSFHGDRTMIVKVDPADVVAIPSDYNNAKGRACRYEVVGELGGGVTKATVQSKPINKDYKPKGKPVDVNKDKKIVQSEEPVFYGGLKSKDIVDMAANHSLTEAARKIGVARSTFTRWLNKAKAHLAATANEPKFVREWPSKKSYSVEAVLKLLSKHGSQGAAARAEHIPASTFKGWVKKAKAHANRS